MSIIDEIRADLFDKQDLGYKDFHAKLIPDNNPDTIIGVRSPEVKKIISKWAKDERVETFLQTLPHQYYEENNVHGGIISKNKDYNRVIEELDRFLPYVDNWATCDSIKPQVFKKHPEVEAQAARWIQSDHTYTIRFGIEMYMSFFLEEWFDLRQAKQVSELRSEEYYVNMMRAWYFATALAKQWDSIIPFFEKKEMDPWTHNKGIQKAIESYRITDEQKAYLRTLKIK